MAKITCPQLNKIIEIDPELSVMDNLIKNQVQVASSCGGDGICGKCRMQVTPAGEIAPASDLEKMTLEKNQGQAGERLSCQLHLKVSAILETTYW